MPKRILQGVVVSDKQDNEVRIIEAKPYSKTKTWTVLVDNAE